jgi:hypothetical protein
MVQGVENCQRCRVTDLEMNEDKDSFQFMGAISQPEAVIDEDEMEWGTEEDNNNSSITQCYICFEPFIVGDSVSWAKENIPCEHVHHTNCITTWLKNHSDCPCCCARIIDPNPSLSIML